MTDDKKTQAVIPLAQQQQPTYYVARNDESWPSSVASHIRLGNGRLEHLEKHIQSRIVGAVNRLTEEVAEGLKNHKQAIEAMNDRVDKVEDMRRGIALSIREAQAEMAQEVSGLRTELNAMKAENDLLRQCLSGKDVIPVDGAITMLRSIR